MHEHKQMKKHSHNFDKCRRKRKVDQISFGNF
jgi:hypothetical protein